MKRISLKYQNVITLIVRGKGFVPASQFHLLSGEENLTEYRFHRKVIAHRFCRVCGVQSFGQGKDGEGNETVAVNVRCLEGVDLKSLNPEFFEGKSW